jgi:peptide/nickel transport system substrate-binding protein
MRPHLVRPSIVFAMLLVVLALTPMTRAQAAEGEMRWGLHVTLAARWLDPAETEALATPFMVLYALHDALVKPMPAGMLTPSLAESWTESKDNLTYTFVIRKNVRFQNGDPVTAEDVKYSFERYKGASAKILKDKVKEIQYVPIYELAFIWGVGPRVEESGAALIPGFAYSAPFEDLKLRK